MTLAWLLVQFAVCAALLGRAGYALCRSADALAEAHGWGRSWVGMALLATVTSLPELASSVSAVAYVDAPNLAAGNLLGACVLNLLFLVVVDALQRQPTMYATASATHILSGAFGVVMLGAAAVGLLAGARAPAVLHVGVYSPMLLVLYVLALKGVHAHQCDVKAADAAACAPTQRGPLRNEWRRFGLATLVVPGAGSWLPAVADGLAAAFGLSRSFVGTVLMAIVTTLPEMAVTLGAMRIGAVDMAIGNLLGSNLFNLLILAVCDAFHVRGPLLADVAAAQTGTAVTAMAMTALVIIGLVMRPPTRTLRAVSWVSVALVVTYAFNAALLYSSGA